MMNFVPVLPYETILISDFNDNIYWVMSRILTKQFEDQWIANLSSFSDINPCIELVDKILCLKIWTYMIYDIWYLDISYKDPKFDICDQIISGTNLPFMQEALPLLIKLLPPPMMICNKLVHFANVFFGVTTRGVHIDQTLALSCSNISKQLGTIFPVLTSDNISFYEPATTENMLWAKSVRKCVFLVHFPGEGGRKED